MASLLLVMFSSGGGSSGAPLMVRRAAPLATASTACASSHSHGSATTTAAIVLHEAMRLCPYFAYGLVRRVNVAPQCLWRSLSTHRVSGSTSTRPSVASNAAIAAAAAATAANVVNAEEMAGQLERGLVGGGGECTSEHCVHAVIVRDARCAQLINRRLYVPGVLLQAFLRCVETSVAANQHDALMAHLHMHCATSPMLQALVEQCTRNERLAYLEETALAEVRPGPEQTSLLPVGSFIGRFAQTMLGAAHGALEPLTAGGGGGGNNNPMAQWWLLVKPSEMERMRAYLRTERHMLFAADTAAQALCHDQLESEALLLILGKCDFAREFDVRQDEDISSLHAATAAASKCNVCFERRALVAVMPCRHSCMCIACARRTLDLHAERCYHGSGYPLPGPGAVCPMCRARATTAMRMY